ncbi:threonine synthase [Rubrivirga sp. IMCC43871]|uniref:threonine synthase n=1 Tax=Rubrivirga sp. IMCC43871 TaxID=3391575 RepID=UPI00398FC488
MSYVRCLRGIASGAEYPADRPMNLDPVDGRPVEMVLDLDRLAAELPDFGWYHPERRDLWRFGALMPLDVADPADRAHIVDIGGGHTPELRYASHALARAHGFDLWVKEEGRSGAGWGGNPTGSFKDRGMAVVVAMARRLGLEKLAVPTQGNAGDALATYGLAGGREVAVAMPDDTPLPILGKVAALAHRHPGRVHLDVVSGTIREAGALIADKYLGDGFFSVATFKEPGWRIEGKKTMGLELAEPRRPGDPWRLPDVIVYPTGGGTGVLGMWKAFGELEALGVIGPDRPRMVSVQSEATTPLVDAFESGAADTTPGAAGTTLATGLNVVGGVGHARVLEILRASGGAAVAVSEAAIGDTLRTTIAETGWWLGSEGAAALAALPDLVDRGLIRPGDRVVAFNTGSLEKYLPALRPFVPDPAPTA